MSVQAKLIIDDKEINVLWFSFTFKQGMDHNGRPHRRPVFHGLDLVIETRRDVKLEYWAFAPDETKQLELHIYPIIDGGRTRKIFFYDCHLIGWKNEFISTGTKPLSETLKITSGGFRDDSSDAEYSAPWRETFSNNDAPLTVIDDTKPSITKINWIHSDTKEIITEIKYAESVSLIAEIINQESSSATITITKEDGSEFQNGETELNFYEAITDDGFIELTSLEIKEQWKEFKTSDIDKLVAKVKHNDTEKKSGALKLLPPPKVLVNFRTGKNYKGEYGFDWIRMGDSGKPGDTWYKEIVGTYNYRKDAAGNYVLDSNGYGILDFKQSDVEYAKLGKQFEMPNHPIKSNDKYVVPVLSILPKEKATLTLKVEIEESDPQKIEYIYDANFLKLDKKEVTYKSVGKKELADELTVECVNEFGTDQFIEVEADGKFAGKIKVVANDKAHRYKAKVLFVQVKTKLGSKPKIGTPSGREKDFTKYFNQALSKATFETVTLDLSSDAVFKSKYTSGGIIKDGDNDLEDLQKHLNTQLYAEFNPTQDYSKHYKIYFIDENCGGLYGIADGVPSISRSVMVFSIGFSDSTVSHETLHAMGLYHPFNGKPDFFFEQFKTDNIMDYSDIGPLKIPVISTWEWQWKILAKNLDNE